jgi:hypothetical protein
MSDGEPGEAGIHVAWRMAVADRAAGAYAPNRRLAVFAVAGSVGSGLADRFSDLELDCYWHEPPGDRDRLAPIEVLGGQVEGFWAYDADEEEWSEEYRLGALPVTVSNFTVSTVESWLDAVTLRADTEPVKHMRLAAIQRCRPLLGTELAGAWRDRADRYPDDLVTAMVHQWLDPGALPGWSAREALASRGDEIALHSLLVSVQTAVLGAVLAINRVYAPHRLAKWQRHTLAGLAVTPARLADRLHALVSAASAAQALDQAEALLIETADLAEKRTGIDLAEFRQILSERREVLDPPSL